MSCRKNSKNTALLAGHIGMQATGMTNARLVHFPCERPRHPYGHDIGKHIRATCMHKTHGLLSIILTELYMLVSRYKRHRSKNDLLASAKPVFKMRNHQRLRAGN